MTEKDELRSHMVPDGRSASDETDGRHEASWSPNSMTHEEAAHDLTRLGFGVIVPKVAD